MQPDPVPFDAEEAKRNHVLFYELPQNLDLNAIDPLLRPVVAEINASGWVWTAECCQGHPDYDENSPGGWDHNTDPFLRLVAHKSRFGDMLAALVEATLLPDTVDRAKRTIPLKVFFWPDDTGDWRQVNVYLEARNVLQRNQGIEALQRFADRVVAVDGSSKK